MKLPFLLSLGRHSKQTDDEGDLPVDVSFAHSSDLSLANHVHGLIPLKRSPCRFYGKEAIPGLTSRLMNRWSCSTRLFKYLTCLSSTDSGSLPAALSSAMALG